MRRLLPAAGLLVAAFLARSVQATPSDALWHATVTVESRGNPRARNRREGAAGVVQIRRACLQDVNRIARDEGLGERFTAADRLDPAKSRRMWELYLRHYGRQYREASGFAPTDEVYARIWNGGPVGHLKASTLAYWQRIISAMQGLEGRG
jgi:hypothetical protein